MSRRARRRRAAAAASRAAADGGRRSGARVNGSSQAPWPETGGDRDKQPRVAVGLEGGAVEREGEDELDPGAIAPGGAKAAADRGQLLVRRGEELVLVPHPDLVGEDERLKGEGIGGAREEGAVAELGLEADAAVAEDRAGIVAASDRVVAGRIFLEAEQGLGAVLAASGGRDGEQGVWPILAVEAAAKHGRGRVAFEPGRRHDSGPEAGGESRAAGL